MDARGISTNQGKIGLPYEQVFGTKDEDAVFPMPVREPLSLPDQGKLNAIEKEIPASTVTNKQAQIMSGSLTDAFEPIDVFDRPLSEEPVVLYSSQAAATAPATKMISPELAERAREYGLFPMGDEPVTREAKQAAPGEEPLIDLNPENDAFNRDEGVLGVVKEKFGKKARSKKKVRPGDIKTIGIYSGAIIFGAVVIWALLNAPAIISRATFLRENPDDSNVIGATQAKSADPNLTVAEYVGGADRMTVNGIGVTDANVIYSNETTEQGIRAELKKGIVHYGNTAYPGQNGNAVYFGHSSNIIWEPGSYNGIFTNLDRVTNGDQIVIVYAGKKYVYEVVEEKVVSPKDLSVLSQSATPQVTLITCTPVGTALRRHVVIAKQISPVPATGAGPADRLPQI